MWANQKENARQKLENTREDTKNECKRGKLKCG